LVAKQVRRFNLDAAKFHAQADSSRAAEKDRVHQLSQLERKLKAAETSAAAAVAELGDAATDQQGAQTQQVPTTSCFCVC